MTQARADLLALACQRIAELDRPAFIKDHMLRYVAANDAYLRLHGLLPGALRIFPAYRDRAREDIERTTLATGEEATLTVTARDGHALGEAEVERFITEGGDVYLFGHMATASTAGLPCKPASGPSPATRFSDEPSDAAVKRSVENALEMLDVGVAVFDADGQLLYRNLRMEGIYGSVVGPLRRGLTLRGFYEALYDFGVAQSPGLADRLGSRNDWVLSRLDLFNQDYSETTELACDGRWLRCLNRRLENGMRILVRLDVSDMKQQEMLLREHVARNELYHSIIEELPVAVFARDRAQKMVFANAAFCDLFGHDRDELIGRTEIESFGEEGVAIHSNNARVLDERLTLAIEETLSHSSGRQFSAMSRTSCVETETGDRFLIGSVIDISDIRAREEALRLAQGRAEDLSRDMSGILSGLPAGVLVFNDQLVIEYVNEAFFQVCGLPRETRIRGELVHHAIELLYFRTGPAGSGGEELAEKLSLLFERGSEASVEFSAGDGSSVLAVSRNLTGGKTLITFSDITALRQHQRELTAQQRELESIGQMMRDTAQVMSQGLFVIDSGIITLSNAAAASAMCVPAELVEPGRPWNDCFLHCVARGDFGTEEQGRRIAAEWQERIRETGSITATFLADGRKWIQFRADLSARGQVLVVLNDLTDLKRRQDELETLLARSEAADRAKTEFLAHMSHEIRTPINGVLGMAELLSKTNLDARQRTFTEIITKSANTLLTVFNDILDFSKIDSGQLVLKPQAFDPLEAIEDVAALHGAAANEKNVDLLIRTVPGLPRRVIGDAGRFRQIVSNFVSNAIRFTEQGHVLIEVWATDAADGRTLLSVKVEDTGIGIDKARLGTIFEKFSRGGPEDQPSTDGTGLGLAITSGLVGLFRGTIEARSQPGAGSAFTVHLPMPKVDVADSRRPLPVTLQGARILVLDDQDLNRAILLEQLGSWGFEACGAEDPSLAGLILEAATAEGLAIDAVLVDCQCDRDALAEFAGQMRGAGGKPPAIILLAAMEQVNRDLPEGLQAEAHVAKPVRANILRNTIIEVLRSRHHPDSPGRHREVARSETTTLAPEQGLVDHPGNGPSKDAPARISIVVAEDNEVNAYVFSQILEAAGHSYALAANGEEAIHLWKRHAPDVILMDVSMPVMDGLEATRRIRHMERVADMPPVAIIAVTAHDTESGRELCLSHGMDDYLAKPISPEALEEKLARWLKGPEAAVMPA